MKLSNETLPSLPDGVSVPTYDRSKLTPGIVHIGVGNFHRAHQAWYLHRLMQKGLAHDWAIIGAGVRDYDKAMREKLLAQDCLTTLIQLDPVETSAEVVGSMIDYLPIEEGNGALVRAMADPQIRIVAMTVTEGGYFVDPATQGFDASHPDIQHDAANPRTPRTVFGAIVEALRLRREAGVEPFAGQSCDNLVANGQILRHAGVSFAKLVDTDLANWIDQNASFPNAMVDCIAPAVGPTELSLAESLGIEDGAPVTHEPFRQWVIEDDFCAGRPEWQNVGVTFTDHVHAYETMKLRILNAGHSVIAEAGQILGVSTIAECMAHSKISAFFEKLEREEIAPTVAAVPGMTSLEYVDLIRDRFSNPRIIDTTQRVASDSSSKHPGFIHHIIRDQVTAGRSIQGLALVEAIWARMCEGTREDASNIKPNDPLWDDLTARAAMAKENPAVWTANDRLYGEISDNSEFQEAFAYWLRTIWKDGLEAALSKYLVD